jgi:hypothetical protein
MATDNPDIPHVDTPSPDVPHHASQTVCLHILSPGQENRRTFSSLPLTTTVGDLKLLIAASGHGQPAPGRQRLIYQGKRLAKDADTLATVLGPIEVCLTPISCVLASRSLC